MNKEKQINSQRMVGRLVLPTNSWFVDEESAYIELKIKLSSNLRKLRTEQK